MTTYPNTYLTTGGSAAVGQREDLSDIIVRLEPQDTPWYTRARKGTSKAVRTDWQDQELAAPAANAQAEGKAFVPSAPIPTVRLDNVHQISTKEISVSGTLESVDKAGRDSELAYQKILKGIELKRDVELAVLGNTAKSMTDPRSLGSFPNYIATAASFAGGTGAVAPTGDGSDAYTPGATDKELTQDAIDDVLESMYNEGGEASYFLMGTAVRRKFSKLGLAAAPSAAVTNQLHMTSAEPATLIGTVAVYLSDFGTHDIVMGRHTPADVFYFVDNRYSECLTLPGRNFMVKSIGETGDSDEYMEIVEHTYRTATNQTHGAIVDIDPALST